MSSKLSGRVRAGLTLAVLIAGCFHTASAARAQAIVTLGSGFDAPEGVAVDGTGNVFVADIGNNAVKEIRAADGTVKPLGSAISPPFGLAVDSHGNVFVVDGNPNGVDEILAVGGTIPSSPGVVSVGNGFNGAGGVAVDSAGNLFVTD